MVLTPTIIAIALGLTPADGGKQVIRVEPSGVAKEIGRYNETIDGSGIRHLRGFDRYGRPYNATVDQQGDVRCVLAGQVIEFNVTDAV